ncbi:MAG: NUDIX domain-containing protein [Candidatus Cardinium sp.]|uniref:NUDIX domain-containing protein n=1 Tax=Cardinium endosymbiont of Dermatophagoides farinae TaxID=2597823 RepID=UPI0011844B45|nr:NUDIX domain-containing protein [Cardinium endosymbiont of Dermatophagoides farinae]TSJ80717.1 NUDIX domain-containing protein [Cardinium endosymbiont of Dermatophagoides farinae]UWW96715.1 MAG: NUDIX domain-containing protein [Candidatus Cardinium sp.]
MTRILFQGGIFASDPLSIDCFYPAYQVSTCYMVCNGKILVLKRNSRAAAGGKWCMPGGKLEKQETALEAVIREVAEETGIMLLPEAIRFTQTICIRILTPKQDFLLHLLKAVLPGAQPADYSVTLNQEHTDYLWVNLQEAGKLNLVAGGNEVLEYLAHYH